MTLALRVLLGIAALLCVAGLLIMNDLTTIWPGAEAALLAASVDGGSNWLPQLLLHQLLAVDTPLFGLRLPSVLLFSVLLVVSYLWSKPLFGHMTALLTSWLLAASLLLPTLAKMAIAESYAVVFQWLTMLALLRFLKQPTLFWRLSCYGLWAVALWVQFLGSALMLLFMAVYLQFKHKEGKRLVGLYFWLVPVVVGGITWAINGLGYPLNPGFAYNHWNSNPLEFLGYNILGVLPFCGFVLAGIWESIQRVKKKEELAIIYVALLVGALVSQSLVLQVVLCLLAAKQLQSYFVANYPYKNIVRTGMVLHLILAFCVVAPLLMFGFYWFGGVGFRAGISAGAVYWMGSFLGVIGIYGMNRRLVWGSALMTGLVASFLYWVQIQPVLETRWSWPQQAVELVRAVGKDTLLVELQELSRDDVLEACAKLEGVSLEYQRAPRVGEGHSVLYSDTTFLTLPVLPAADSLVVWGEDFEELRVWVVR